MGTKWKGKSIGLVKIGKTHTDYSAVNDKFNHGVLDTFFMEDDWHLTYLFHLLVCMKYITAKSQILAAVEL